MVHTEEIDPWDHFEAFSLSARVRILTPSGRFFRGFILGGKYRKKAGCIGFPAMLGLIVFFSPRLFLISQALDATFPLSYTQESGKRESRKPDLHHTIRARIELI
jgi:hypothetical protein